MSISPESNEPSVRWRRVLAGLILLSLALEVSAQLFIYAWAGKRFQSLNFYRWSPYGLVRNNPRLTSNAFDISKNGFRSDREFSPRKPDRTLRVLVLGGSVAYSGLGKVPLPGKRVRSNETIASYLEAELRNDSALAGLNIEVINAAVNFNRINEVMTGYLNEYVFWEPDLVLVMGSANNFGYAVPQGHVYSRQAIMQAPHSWRLDFDRQVIRTDVSASLERLLIAGAENSAFLALARKFGPETIDVARNWVAEHSFGGRGGARPLGPTWRDRSDKPPADEKEWRSYVDEYLGYAEALAAGARQHNQHVAFFWEHFIVHLEGERPFNDEERWLFDMNRSGSAMPEDKIADRAARDQVEEHFRGREGVSFLDPIDLLKSEPRTIFIDYLHYTAEGNKVMAAFVYGKLRDVFRDRAHRILEGSIAGKSTAAK